MRSRPITFIASAVGVSLIALGVFACGGDDKGATATTGP
jgi:hypothetical protein